MTPTDLRGQGRLCWRADWPSGCETTIWPKRTGLRATQLLMKKHIDYTAHNSAVCISVDTENMEGVWETTRDFLALESAPGSNAGLCLSRWESVSHEVIVWGQRAKKEVLTLEDAQATATRAHVRFAALKGSGVGVIGALAAIGLHREGNDGRFLWLPGLPDLQGKFSVGEIFERTAIDRVCTLEGVELPIDALVEIGDWTLSGAAQRAGNAIRGREKARLGGARQGARQGPFELRSYEWANRRAPRLAGSSSQNHTAHLTACAAIAGGVAKDQLRGRRESLPSRTSVEVQPGHQIGLWSGFVPHHTHTGWSSWLQTKAFEQRRATTLGG